MLRKDYKRIHGCASGPLAERSAECGGNFDSPHFFVYIPSHIANIYMQRSGQLGLLLVLLKGEQYDVPRVSRFVRRPRVSPGSTHHRQMGDTGGIASMKLTAEKFACIFIVGLVLAIVFIYLPSIGVDLFELLGGI